MNLSAARLIKSEVFRPPDSQGRILTRYILHTLPLVKKELQRWRSSAVACTDPALRTQALSSLKNKDFHCYGGAVFALSGEGQEDILIGLITAYQTICDYLDNLCDRNECLDGDAFRQLHTALLDALQPGAADRDYYRRYPNRDDGGYLAQLVEACQDCIEKLPSYPAVQSDVLQLVSYYIDLQVKKHISWQEREKVLIAWAEAESVSYVDIHWQEFAAASGSTLAVFALFALATRKQLTTGQVQTVKESYFPWICGLHILLDYFIDRDEDRQGNDLNFTFYYEDEVTMSERLKYFIRQSHACIDHLENHAFARTVVEGLLAMYLSDRKIKNQKFDKTAAALLDESGSNTWHIYRLCALVRKFF